MSKLVLAQFLKLSFAIHFLNQKKQTMLRILKVFAAGAVLGILFAPQSGEKTRKKLGKLFSEYKEDAKDYVMDAADELESKVKSAKKAVKNL